MWKQLAPLLTCRVGLTGSRAIFQRFCFCFLLVVGSWLPTSSFASFAPFLQPNSAAIASVSVYEKGLCDGWAGGSIGPCGVTVAHGVAQYCSELGYGVNSSCVTTRDKTASLFSYKGVNYTSNCGLNATLTNGVCVCNSPSIESGSSCITNPQPAICVARAAAPGVEVVNFTVGYRRTDNSDDYSVVGAANQLPTDGKLCDNLCQVQISEPVAAWASKTPTAQGLYRLSLDLAVKANGSMCDGGPAELELSKALTKTTPAPVCPGYVGEVNGKIGCYGTASKPVITTSISKPQGPGGNGNPAAGLKPQSGEGSGNTGASRTPSVGTGDNAGGPASSSAGVGGSVVPGGTATGTVVSPPVGEEQVACGAPGQPKCGIDETGTGDGKGMETSGLTSLGTSYDQLNTSLGSITSTGDKNTGWGLVPKWLQSGSCSPAVLLKLPPIVGSMEITIDLCPHLPMIYTLMNLLWVVWTFFATVGMVFAVTTAKGS